MGFLNKHILAPRAMTQEQMNLNFLGTPYNLGERYTVGYGICRAMHRLITQTYTQGRLQGFDESSFCVFFLFGPISSQFFVWLCHPLCTISC